MSHECNGTGRDIRIKRGYIKARDFLSHECNGAWRGVRIKRVYIKARDILNAQSGKSAEKLDFIVQKATFEPKKFNVLIK